MPRIILASVVVALLAALPAFATQRYVDDTGGVDTGTCTNPGSPCLTIEFCVEQMGDGDVCNVADGTYTDIDTITAPHCQTTGCTVKSTNLHGALIDMTGLAPASPWFIANDKGIWTWDGFAMDWGMNGSTAVIDGTVLQSLADPGDADAFTVKNMRMEWTHNGNGPDWVMLLGLETVLIENNYAHPDSVCQSTCGGATGDCDFEATSQAQFVIADQVTTLTYTRNDMGHMRNVTTSKDVFTLTATRNLCSNATNHGCFTLEDVDVALFENNILQVTTEGACSDDQMQGGFVDVYCADDITIRNNTYVGRAIGYYSGLFNGYDLDSQIDASSCMNDATGPNVIGQNHDNPLIEKLHIYNNIIYDNSTSTSLVANIFVCQITGTGSYFRSDYNMEILPADAFLHWITEIGGSATIANTFGGACPNADVMQCMNVDGDAYTEGAHSINAAPGFANYSTGDFRPASGTSNMVNVGRNTGTFEGVAYVCPSVDYDGNSRSDGNCDIGAFEWNSGAVCGNNVTESGEVCDGTDLDGETCVTQGYSGGTLTCAGDCLSFVTSACTVTARPMLRGAVARGTVVR